MPNNSQQVQHDLVAQLKRELAESKAKEAEAEAKIAEIEKRKGCYCKRSDSGDNRVISVYLENRSRPISIQDTDWETFIEADCQGMLRDFLVENPLTDEQRESAKLASAANRKATYAK